MSAARPASSSVSTPSSASGSSSLWSFVIRFLDGTSLKDLALKLSSLKIPFLDSAQTSLVSAFLFFSILGAAFYVIDAFRNRFLRRTPLPGVDKDYSVYDYIVVGSGASGGALAARLAQYLPNASVLLMEAGGDDADEMLVSVPAAPMQLQRSAHDWSYRTVPQKDSHNTTQENRAVWPRGRILGGSSSINYMIVVRGVAADYDNWAKKYGCEGWGWQDCLPFFKNLESLDPNSFAINSNTSAARGLTGPVTISRHAQPSPHNAAFIKAAAAVTRTAVVDDYNRGDNSGFAHIQVNTRQGVRCNSSVAYIKPALQSLKNFSVATWSHVTRVLFNDKKEAVGVEFRRGKNVTELRQSSLYRIVARKEVILCGGAVNSPQILMLSGVGPADHLKQHKIPVIADVPGVGQNLRDHMASPMVYESRIPTLSLADQTAWNFIRWKLWGTGPFTSNMVESHGFISTGLRSNDDEMKGRPDVQILYGSGTFGADDFSNFGTKPEIVDLFRAMSKNISYTSFILPTLLHPESVGEIRLASNDPLQHPIIDPRYLSHPRDIATLVEACKISQNIMDRPEMKAVAGRFLSGELMPELVQKFDRYKDPNSYFDGHIRNQCGTLYHPVGTCRMGPLSDVNTVCSPDLRVKGVKKLRVADASIMPTLMSGNTNIPCMMIGERAAFIIAQQAKVATSAAPSKAQSAATPTGKAKL